MTLAEPRTALVADAEEACRRELASLLRDEGLRAHLAMDDEEAIEIVRYRSIDVVVVQFELPEAGGLDVLREVQETASRRVPCVLIAREVSPRVQLRAMDEGAFSVVPKPIDVSVMRGVLRGMLRRFFESEQ